MEKHFLNTWVTLISVSLKSFNMFNSNAKMDIKLRPNESWQYPPKHPVLGYSFKGPFIRNLAIPKADENIEVAKEVISTISLLLWV